MQGSFDKESMATPGIIRFSKFRVYQDQQDYIPGGVTFNYPIGLFNSPPNVRLSIQLKNLIYTPTLVITPIVVTNSATSTLVMVNLGTIGIAESLLDDVTIHLFASE